MKNKQQINLVIISLMLTLILFSSCLSYVYSTSSDNSNSGDLANEFTINLFEESSNEYMSDKEVIKVYETCLDSEIKTVCVYENIEFIWSESLEPIRDYYFFSPTELVNYNGLGLCRDISVFRMAVLRKLGIHAEFVFVPGHVYLKSFENGKFYELNNEYIFSEGSMFVEIK